MLHFTIISNVFVEFSFLENRNILVLKHPASCQAPLHILLWHNSDVWHSNCLPEAIIYHVEQMSENVRIKGLLIFWPNRADPDSFIETWTGSANM